MFCARYLPRLLHIGLIAFAIALLAGTLVEKTRMREAAPAVAITADVTVIDVARGVDVGMLSTLVKLAADERVIAIDDQPVENDLAAGALLGQRTLGANTYLDLAVGSARGTRRVLVLLH